ncbi:MAG: formate dehydrogenase accessory sulfurtransferase FdhD [Thermodesulfobacteriota bacterium]
MDNELIQKSTTDIAVKKVKGSHISNDKDVLAVEEPLEIRIGFYQNGTRKNKNISITMRTPGEDFDLAAGFLFTEGIIKNENQIKKIKNIGSGTDRKNESNIVFVELEKEVDVDIMRLERHFYTTSSCGVCGKTSLDALEVKASYKLPKGEPVFNFDLIYELSDILRKKQTVFGRTGGLHAAGLFDDKGNLVSVREDIGRHNAVDKLIGNQLLRKKIPLSKYLLMLSGRASFELLQKALVAGIPIVASVGAPSSLAVDLAKKFDITLLGFVRDKRFNIYSGEERILVKNEIQNI